WPPAIPEVFGLSPCPCLFARRDWVTTSTPVSARFTVAISSASPGILPSQFGQPSNRLTQHRRAPFMPSRALPDLEYLGEVGSMGSAVCPSLSSDGRSNGVHSRRQLFANAAIAASRVAA